MPGGQPGGQPIQPGVQPGQPGGWMPAPAAPPNCPPGLEYLAQIDQLLVKQKIEGLESKCHAQKIVIYFCW